MSTIKTIFARKKPAAPAANAVESDEETNIRPIEWPLIKKMLRALLPYKKQYALGISCAYLQVFADLTGPAFVGTIVNFIGDYVGQNKSHNATWLDRIIHAITGPFDPAALSQSRAITLLAALVIAWAGAIIISVFAQRVVILITTRAGERVQFDYRIRMFEHLQRLDMGFYDRTKLGRIISRCTSDINSMREANVWGPAHIVIQSSVIAIAVGLLVTIDWHLFLAIAWLGPVTYVVNKYFLRKVALAWQVQREGFTRVSTNLAENITGMRVVTAFNRQSPNLAAFNRLQVVNTANNVANARINGTFQPVLEIIRYTGRIILLGYGGYLVAAGRLSLGGVVAAYLYWDFFVNPIIFLGSFFSNGLAQALAGAERVIAFLDTDPQVFDLPDAKVLPPITGEVTFENVTFGYKPESPVLHDVSFTARPGQMFALVGHTGSGKSSIISLIARFYQPQQGRVRSTATTCVTPPVIACTSRWAWFYR